MSPERFLEGWFIGTGLLTFILFGIDKKRAVREEWRIRERTLLLLCIIGGSAGGLIGMTVFRHKIRKFRFVAAVPVLFTVQLALLLYVLKLR